MRKIIQTHYVVDIKCCTEAAFLAIAGENARLDLILSNFDGKLVTMNCLF